MNHRKTSEVTTAKGIKNGALTIKSKSNVITYPCVRYEFISLEKMESDSESSCNFVVDRRSHRLIKCIRWIGCFLQCPLWQHVRYRKRLYASVKYTNELYKPPSVFATGFSFASFGNGRMTMRFGRDK